jgi:hypothetical protein
MEVKDMDDRQRQQIRELREEGYGYGRIAQILEISENTIKTYCRRHGLGGVATNLASSEGKRQYCPCCKSVMELIPGRKPKKFCSDKCRMKWWNSHLDQVKRKPIIALSARYVRNSFPCMEMQIGSTVPTHATSKPDSEVMRYDKGTGKKRSRVSDDHECSTSDVGKGAYYRRTVSEI